MGMRERGEKGWLGESFWCRMKGLLMVEIGHREGGEFVTGLI